MNYQILFVIFGKLRKMLQNLSSAAVMNGTLRDNFKDHPLV